MTAPTIDCQAKARAASGLVRRPADGHAGYECPVCHPLSDECRRCPWAPGPR